MMSPTTSVEIKVNYTGSNLYNGLPEHTFTMLMEDATEISCDSWFLLFERVLAALGYDETAVMSGACSLAFNELRDHSEMKKVAQEHDLALLEDPDYPKPVKLESPKNPEKKPLYEIVQDDSDIYGSAWPQKLAKMFRVIAHQIEINGEDEYGIYQTTGEDVREWLYKEAHKAEKFWGSDHEPEREP